MKFTKGLAKTLDTYEKWWAGDLDRALIPVILTGNETGREPPRYPYEGMKSFSNKNISPEEFVDSVDYELSAMEFLGDSYPLFNGQYVGPGAMAAFLGADIHFTAGSNWFIPEKELPINELKFEYLENNFWYKRVRDIMSEAKSRWGDSVVIGMPDLGGVFDILATFRGTESLLTDLYDSPDEVKRVVDEIKVLWHRYYEELTTHMTEGYYTDWSAILSKERSYMMQSDFSYMLGPDMFDEFVLGELADTCAFLDRGCYHLDGIGQIPFIESLLETAKMDLIQWVPGDGDPATQDWFELYCQILDKDKHLQINYDDDFSALDKLINHYGTGKKIVRGTVHMPASMRENACKLLSRYGIDP